SEISLEHGFAADAVLHALPYLGDGLVDFRGVEAQIAAILAGRIGLQLSQQVEFLPRGEQGVMGDAHGRDLVFSAHALTKTVENHGASPCSQPEGPFGDSMPRRAGGSRRGGTITFSCAGNSRRRATL